MMDKEQEREQAAFEPTNVVPPGETPIPKGVSGDQADALMGGLLGASPTLAAGNGAAGTANAQAPKAANAGNRLTPFPSYLDVGEQIIGSGHEFFVTAPFNLHESLTADASFSIDNGAFVLQSSSMTLQPVSAMQRGEATAYHLSASPRFVFRPTKRGPSPAVLTFTARWSDGHEETQTLVIRGRARALDDAPSDAATPEEIAADMQQDGRAAKRRSAEQALIAEDAKVEEPLPRGVEDRLDKVSARAKRAARRLAAHQATGLGIAEDEAVAFAKQPEKVNRSLWWDLAEIGLTMATAGLANVIAKQVGPSLAKRMAGIGNGGGEPSERLKAVAGHLSDFTTDALKEGLKIAGKKAIAKSLPKGNGAKGNKGDASGEGARSSNARIDFFAGQENVLADQEEENEIVIEERAEVLGAVARDQPDAAIAALEEVADAFESQQGAAEQAQANATATQWVTLIARLTLGTEDVKDPDVGGHDVNAADLSDARPEGRPDGLDGLLDIEVSSPEGRPKVVGARLHGVSQEIADRIAHVRLSDVPMPVRIVMGTKLDDPTLVTRDDAGRVRSEGDFGALGRHGDLEERATTEAQAHRGTTTVTAEVLEKSLDEWGVEIKTDDATGRR
jgi:hypothetical protein